MGEGQPQNFLQACLLLLLRERPAHGYDLVRRLQALRHRTRGRGGVYRMLRELERQGLVESLWHTSEAGPPRRMYRITSQGISELARQTDALAETHNELHAFLERYERSCESEVSVDI